MKKKRIHGIATGMAVALFLYAAAFPIWAKEEGRKQEMIDMTSGDIATPGNAALKMGEKHNITVTVNQMETDSITIEGRDGGEIERYLIPFEFGRKHVPINSDTYNDLVNPGKMHVSISLDGEDTSGSVELVISSSIKDKVSVTDRKLDLAPGQPVEFNIEFTDLAALEGNFNLSEQTEDNTISVVSSRDGSEVASLAVLYSAVGEYDFYSAHYVELYSGKVIEDISGGRYVSVGTIDLSDYKTAVIDIEHTFWKVKTRESCLIDRVELDGGGDYTFKDGSYVQKVKPLEHEEVLTSTIKMKSKKFKELQKAAEFFQEDINTYAVLGELSYFYTDGYEVGGTVDRVPLLVHLVYSYDVGSGGSGGSSGGSGSGGNGGSGGGGGGSTGGPSINKPENIARTATTKVVQGDIGWTLRDGSWYYRNGGGDYVVGWLMTLDGKWYYLDAEGKMKIGWVQVDSKWYYLNTDGSMAVNTKTPDGFSVGQDGSWII